jgi:hypothetical protein
MRVVKITKTMMKDPETLLIKIGAVVGRNGYPNHVFMNSKDYEVLKRNVKNNIKKSSRNISKMKVEYYAGLIMLNLGPRSLKNGVQKGYLLVDDAAIEREKGS